MFAVLALLAVLALVAGALLTSRQMSAWRASRAIAAADADPTRVAMLEQLVAPRASVTRGRVPAQRTGASSDQTGETTITDTTTETGEAGETEAGRTMVGPETTRTQVRANGANRSG